MLGVLGSRPDRTRWPRRPYAAASLRLSLLAAPIAASVLVTVGLARDLPAPGSVAGLAGWWVAVLSAGLATVLVGERLCRRALPLAALLDLSLTFPDQAPARFAVARRRGRLADLRLELERLQGARAPEAATRPLRVVLGLIASLSVHDGRTRGHAERVRVFAEMIAEEMRIPADDRDRLRWTALLHDIGKLEVPPALLNKPGSPTDAEWRALRRHPEDGARFTRSIRQWLGPWGDGIEQHHERLDGSGYPKGLRAEQIGVAARIVAVADAFETMTAVRPYRRPVPPVAAREELVRFSGTQFDPAVCRAFLQISVGRLWRAAGIGAWIAQVPFAARWVGPRSAALGRQLGGAAGATGATVLLCAGGLVSVPLAVAGAPPGTMATAPAHAHATAPAPAPAPVLVTQAPPAQPPPPSPAVAPAPPSTGAPVGPAPQTVASGIPVAALAGAAPGAAAGAQGPAPAPPAPAAGPATRPHPGHCRLSGRPEPGCAARGPK